MQPSIKQEVILQERDRIIIYDGVCSLCHFSIRFIIRFDAGAKFSFVAAQSEKGGKYQQVSGVDTLKDGTVILLKHGQVFTKSDAALEIARDLDGPVRYLHLLKVFPKTLRDWLYSIISKNRYNWFGKKDCCLVPDDNLRSRFL